MKSARDRPMADPPAISERVAEIEAELSDLGSISVLLIDGSPLVSIEQEYGTLVYDTVRGSVIERIDSLRSSYRQGDRFFLDRRRGLGFLLFLDRKRSGGPLLTSDLLIARNRIAFEVRDLADITRQYMPLPGLKCGYGVAIANQLLHTELVIDRTVACAKERADHFHRAERLAQRDRLKDLLLCERVRTEYQPIYRMKEGSLYGYEALARGQSGSGFESANALFMAATEHGFLFEVDRLCRKRALRYGASLPPDTKLFVNTVPQAMRDPRLFETASTLAPERVVIEITEHQVIANHRLFRERMAEFTAAGMHFAVDDVGSGYSGLELIAGLKPSYLKIDMNLVRNVHVAPVHRAIVRAILELGRGMGAKVIAEGIQNSSEAEALRELDVDLGQGFHLGRPERSYDDPPNPPSP